MGASKPFPFACVESSSPRDPKAPTVDRPGIVWGWEPGGESSDVAAAAVAADA